ncbi:preprotein translocase subunit SecG [Pedobacter sp.]|uniref:preprotein translocase subunit SecG n=1 Tax=Pedobacter sp. TaxID=1411316 RepID=UPI003D7FC89F
MIFLIILLIIICVALGLFVLIQNPKGGGLAAGASGGSNMFGVQRTGDVLEKGTWVLLTLVVVLTLCITTISKTGTTSSSSSKIQEQLDKTPTPSPINQAPANTTPPVNEQKPVQ